MLVYSVTDPDSLDNIKNWVASIREKADSYLCIFLLANKTDLQTQRCVDFETADEVANQFDLIHRQVSCKSGLGVHDAFVEMGEIILEKRNYK